MTMMAEATMMSLDELTSRIRLLLDLNGVKIHDMSASVFDMLVDCPLEEITIKGWNDSPMKLLELCWDYAAWPGGRSLSTLRGDDRMPGLRVLLQGPDDAPEGPVFCDICIHVRRASPTRRHENDQ